MRSQARAKDAGLGGEAGEPSRMNSPDPSGLDPAQGDQERGGASRERARHAKHEGAPPLLGRDLQPAIVRGRDGFSADQRGFTEIERDEREARTAGEKISGVECRPESPPALHPQELLEIDTGRASGSGIECIRSVHESRLATRGGGPGQHGQEQTARP